MDFGRMRVVFWKDFWRITNDYKRFRLQNLLWWLGRQGAYQEDLIICVAFWTLYKRRFPLLCDDFRAGCIASRNKLLSRPHLFASPLDFGGFWGGFGRRKWTWNCIFQRYFAAPLPSVLLNRIFGDFLKSEPWFSAHSQCFVRIFTKSTFSKKLVKKQIWDPFWEARATKNWENIMLKNIIFSNVDFSAFFDRF